MTDLAPSAPPPSSPGDFYEADTADMPLVGNAPPPETAGAAAIFHHVLGNALPTAGGVAAFPAGFAYGGALGGPFGEFTAPIGGLAAAFGAGGLIEHYQGEALDAHPMVAATLGLDPATRAAEEAQHPLLSLFGSVLPQAAFFRPGGMTWKGAAIGGGIAAGVAGGTELAQTGHISVPNVVAQGLAGTILNRPTALGEWTMGGWLSSRFSSSGATTTARLAADDVTSAGAAEFHVDDAAVKARADAISETHPNLSPATRESYARAELLSEHAGIHATPDERAAGAVIQGDAHAEASNPFMGPGAADAHGERYAAATAALTDDAPMPDLGVRPAQPARLPFDSWRSAIEHVESRGNPDAVSPKGALGRMQVMPATAAKPGHGIRPAADHSDAELTRVGTELLGALEQKYGDQVLATAAYNAGEGKVDKWLRSIGDPRDGSISHEEFVRRIPLNETRKYVGDVFVAAGHGLPEDVALRPDALPTDDEGGITPEQYVDRQLAGEGRGDSVADLELRRFAADNGPAIDAELARRLDFGFDRRLDLSPAEAPAEQPAGNLGSPAPPPTGGAEAEPTPQFDPIPFVPALRDYVNDRRNSLEAEAVAQKLGLEVDQARRVLGTLAASRESGMFISRSGQLRRVIARRGPVDALTLIADRGGLRDDEGHDLARGRGLQTMIPGAGPLIRKSGMSIDAAGELLHDRRYFLERPTEAEVLKLLDRAARKKAYPLHEQEQAEHAARGREMDESEQRARDELAEAAEPFGGLTDDQAEMALRLRARGETAEDAALMAIEQSAAEALEAKAIETDNPDYDMADADEHYYDRPPPEGWDPNAEDHFGDAAETRPGGEGQGRQPRDAGRGAAFGGPAPEGFGEPAGLERFDDPAGAAAQAQADAIEHDLRMAIDPTIAERQRQQAELGAKAPLRKPVEQEGTMGLSLFDSADQPEFRLLDEGEQTTIKAVLEGIDAEQAAVAALKACMPGGG